tara:strand:- start:3596 stop:3850 length:255 start_codon:yes stop_codon:yes gene_type:complete
MDKHLVEAFVSECKREQEWVERYKSNYIEFDNYFKYSGEVENDSQEWIDYLEAQKYANIKAPPFEKSRSNYFRIYWLTLKNKKL